MSKLIQIRKAQSADKEALTVVESKSTPNLRYVPHVFDQFVADQRGEFSVAEIDGRVVGCAKFTVTPNDSAWVETLRVIPEFQGMGIGKRLYERFFEVADREKIDTLRMYTGLRNVVSRGLAEHFEFQLEETFFEANLSAEQIELGADKLVDFQPVTDKHRTTALVKEQSNRWHNFLVMNRTFYKLTPSLCAYLVENGQVYEEPASGAMVIQGARFMPWQALHIGFFAENHEASLRFAMQKVLELKVSKLTCMFPEAATNIKNPLIENRFEINENRFIVMKKTI